MKKALIYGLLLWPVFGYSQLIVDEGATLFIEAGATVFAPRVEISGVSGTPGVIDNNGGVLDIDQASSSPVSGFTDGNLVINDYGQLNGGTGRIEVEGDVEIGENGVFNFETSKFIIDAPGARSITKIGGTTPSKTIGFYRLFHETAGGLTIGSNIHVEINHLFYHADGALTLNGDWTFKSTSPTEYGIYGRQTSGLGIGGVHTFEVSISNIAAGWRQLSMPFQPSNNISTWNPVGIPLAYAGASGVAAGQENIFHWDALDAGSGVAGGWKAAVATDNKKAYSVYLEQGSDYDFTQTFSLDGNDYTSTTYAQDLKYTDDPGNPSPGDAAGIGWNFVPNPWPAMLNISEMLDDVGFTPTYKAIHLYDASGGYQYQAILKSGETLEGYNTSGGFITDDLSATLGPAQAFWVKANADQTLTLTESVVRDTARGNQNTFLKKKRDGFQLSVFTKDSLWDGVKIYFDEAADHHFNSGFDAYKLYSLNENAPSFYGYEAEEKSTFVARQPSVEDSVVLGFELNNNQPFHIYPDFEQLDPSWSIFLKDREKLKYYELKDKESPVFYHHESFLKDRFVVYYTKRPESFERLVLGSDPYIDAFVVNGILQVQSMGVEGPVKLSAFDISGRQLLSSELFIEKGEMLNYDLGMKNIFVLLRVDFGTQTKVFKLYL